VDERPYHNRDWIRAKYWDEGLSTRQIADLVGVNGKTIYRWLVKLDIPTRNRKLGGQETYKCKEWLEHKYWDEGLSTVEMGELVDRCHETICLWMNHHSIPRRDPTTAYSTIFPPEQLKEAVRLYREGYSLADLKERYNVSQRQLQKNLDRAGVEYRDQNRQYTTNEHVFDDLSDERAAYWGGFLYADACGIRTTVLQVRLAAKDKKHLEKLRDFVTPNHPIYVAHYDNRDFATLAACGVHLAERLVELGIVVGRPTIPPAIRNLRSAAARHWIRGLFDGDGSATKCGRISLCGNRESLEFVRARIAEATKLKPDRPIRSHSISNVYYLDYHRGYPARIAAEYMYKNATVYLERKRNRMLDIWPDTCSASVPALGR